MLHVKYSQMVRKNHFYCLSCFRSFVIACCVLCSSLLLNSCGTPRITVDSEGNSEITTTNSTTTTVTVTRSNSNE